MTGVQTCALPICVLFSKLWDFGDTANFIVVPAIPCCHTDHDNKFLRCEEECAFVCLGIYRTCAYVGTDAIFTCIIRRTMHGMVVSNGIQDTDSGVGGCIETTCR